MSPSYFHFLSNTTLELYRDGTLVEEVEMNTDCPNAFHHAFPWVKANRVGVATGIQLKKPLQTSTEYTLLVYTKPDSCKSSGFTF